MRVPVACRRGNIAERNRHGHCQCVDCKAFRRKRDGVTRRPGYAAEWRAANKDKSRAYSKKWVAANKAKRAEIVKRWRERNPDKVAAMSRKAGAAWSARNAGKRNALTAARRAAILLRTPPWADRAAIEAVYEEAARLTRETGLKHEVDHVFPLQGKTMSGLHIASNLRIVTRFENRSKGNKPPCEF